MAIVLMESVFVIQDTQDLIVIQLILVIVHHVLMETAPMYHLVLSHVVVIQDTLEQHVMQR